MDRLVARAELRAARSSLDAARAGAATAAACARLAGLDVWTRARTVALYRAVGGELDVDDLARRAEADGKVVTYPVTRPGRRLDFARPAGQWRPNRLGIPEPTGAVVAPDELDLVVVPLVGFARDGTRLGTGGGYYDRTFAGRSPAGPPVLVGIAFALQELPGLGREPWDVPLDAVVTETEVIDCRG